MSYFYWFTVLGVYAVTVSELLLSDMCNLWYRAEENDLCYFHVPR